MFSALENDDSNINDLILIVTPGLIWGASFLFIAQGLESIGPAGVTFARILIGFLTLAMFPQARKSIDISAWPRTALLGIMWMAFPLSMFPYAEQHVSSALTGVLNGAVPIFTTTVACIVDRKRPSRGIVLGLAVGLFGALLVALPTMGEGHNSMVGVLMILAAVVSYGFVLNIALPLQKKYGPIPVLWRAQMVALVLTAPMGLPDLIHAHWKIIPFLSILALGSLGTGVAFVVMTIASGRVGPAKASVSTFFTPVVALLLGVLVRGERVAITSIVGGLICLSGALIVRRANIKKAPTPTYQGKVDSFSVQSAVPRSR